MGKCRTCRYNRRNHDGEYVCSNVDSDSFGLETDCDEGCFDHEAKDGEDE